MAKKLQVQQRAWSPPPPPVGEDSWHQPWSEPKFTRKLAAIAIACAVSGAVVPPFNEVTLVSKWFEPLSEPVRQKPGLRAALQDIAADVPNTQLAPFGWNEQWTDPVKVRRFSPALQDVSADVYQVSEVVTEDKWHFPWSEPVRFRRFSPTLQDVSADVLSTTSSIISTTTLSSQVSFKRRLIYQSVAQTPPELFRPDKWFIPWSEPVRQKLGLAQRLQQTTTADTKPVVSFSWFAPLTDPVRPKVGLRVGLQDIAADFASQTVSFGWNEPWTDPFRMRRFSPSLQDVSADVYFTTEIITLDKWFEPWADPVRTRRLAAAQQQPLAWNNFTPATETIFEDKWHFPWSEPVRFRRLATAHQQALVWNPFTPNFTGTATATSAVSSPVHFRRRLIYQAQAYTVFTPAAEIITVDKWFEPLTEPVRRRLFPTAAQQALAAIPFNEIVTIDKWLEGLSEPVRVRRFLAAEQQFANAIFPTEVVTLDKWFEWLSEPQRFRRFLTAQQQALTQATQPIVSFGYYEWLSEPQRFKKGLPAYEQREITQAPVFPNLPTIIPWWKPFDEPVRPKKGLRAYLQQSTVLGTAEVSHVINVILDATETNGDVANIYATVYNRPVRAYVSIKEIPRADTAYASFEET